MPPSSRSSLPRNAVAWALLSQSLWLPLLAIDLHDRWQAEVKQQAEIAGAMNRLPNQAGQPGAQEAVAPSTASLPQPGPDGTPAAAGSAQAGILLGSATPSGPLAEANRRGSLLESAQGTVVPPQAGRGMRSSQGPTARISGGAPGGLALGWRQADQDGSPLGPNPLLGSFNRAEMLGGSLGLADLRGGAMPPLALAERARWAQSGDPLAPLPRPWREPMRKAIGAMPQKPEAGAVISGARVVHVPSTRVRQSTVVPLALQPDGSVDILTQPDNPAVVEEIRRWSARQTPSPGSGVTAAVVHLEPLPEAPRPISPPMPGARRSAAPQAAAAIPSPAAAVPSAPAPAPVVPTPVAEAPAAAPAPAPAAPAPLPVTEVAPAAPASPQS
jgi:hypothetical protein